jgi:hypothetical protein
VGSRGRSGVVTDDSETFRLDNVESEVVGGACGAADGGEGGISKNGSVKCSIEGQFVGLFERYLGRGEYAYYAGQL